VKTWYSNPIYSACNYTEAEPQMLALAKQTETVVVKECPGWKPPPGIVTEDKTERGLENIGNKALLTYS